MCFENTYSIHDVIRALKYKDSYYTKAGTTGNFDLIHIVIDAERVLEEANLTDRQRQVIELYWIKDWTLAEVGKALGISHQAVADSVEQSKNKLQKILDVWRTVVNGIQDTQGYDI